MKSGSAEEISYKENTKLELSSINAKKLIHTQENLEIHKLSENALNLFKYLKNSTKLDEDSENNNTAIMLKEHKDGKIGQITNR